MTQRRTRTSTRAVYAFRFKNVLGNAVNATHGTQFAHAWDSQTNAGDEIVFRG